MVAAEGRPSPSDGVRLGRVVSFPLERFKNRAMLGETDDSGSDEEGGAGLVG
jgi:hypothetical protein